MEEWDELNDETFGGGSDDNSDDDWEQKHHDFAAERGQSVNPAKAAHPSTTGPRPIPGRSGATGGTRMHRELADMNMPFEMETDPMEQKLAKSFDEFFTEDDIEDEPAAAEAPPRRARNISESELFPDSYKFSPPPPSLNIGETIWNATETPPQDDNDYIANHIKALLNIQSKPKPKPKPDQNRVYTLEELENDSRSIPRDIAPPPGLEQQNASGRQLPIGTPPKASYMSPNQFMQPHHGMQGNMSMQPPAPNITQRGGNPAMMQHQAAAMAQMRNQYAMASMMMSNPSQASAFIQVTGGANSNLNRSFPGGGFPPRPNMRGQMQSRQQGFRNQQGQRNQRQDNRRFQQKDREPLVKGLMTQKELEWIVKVQLMQLKMTDLQAEDFYYQQWINKSRRQNSSASGASTEEGARNASSSSNEESNSPSTRKQVRTPPLQNTDNSAAMATESQNTPKVYEPRKFENTLGKISVGSVYKPRKMLDIDFVNRNLTPTRNALKDHKKHREHLLFIEKCITLFEDMNTLKDRLKALPEDDQRSEFENGRKEVINSILIHFDTNDCETIVRNMLLCGEKGCRVLGDLLLNVDSDQCISIMLAIFTSLHVAVKKEAASKSTSFGLCLGTALRTLVPGLEVVDQLELLDLLLATSQWEKSRLACSLVVVLVLSLQAKAGGEEDRFVHDRLIELLVSANGRLDNHLPRFPFVDLDQFKTAMKRLQADNPDRDLDGWYEFPDEVSQK